MNKKKERKLKENSYTPHQKFIVDEYGEHWQKMPDGKYRKLGKLENPTKTIAKIETPDGYLNADDLCEFLEINKRTLARWIRDGKVEFEKRGKAYFFTQEEAERLKE
jgi:hypothetical protein